MAEVWIRNPITCIRECAELLVPNIAWDRGFAYKNRLDPQKHLEIHYPSAVNYRLLMVGDQGTAELRRGYSIQKPYAVYPTWEYGRQTIPELESLLAHPVAAGPRSQPADERPVAGQEHRVVIIRPPDPRGRIGRAFQQTLADLQHEYTEAIIHYHGTYAYRIAFGMGYRAADIDPVAHAAKGRITLASGRSIRWEEAPKYMQWINLAGMTIGDLSKPRNRTMFNIKSAQWAAEHFSDNIKFRTRGEIEIDPYAAAHKPPETRHFRNVSVPAQPGDKLLCGRCSLAPTCKYYRDGGVCTVPDTDGAALAKQFRTRDSDQIIDALGIVLDKQMKRLEAGLEQEDIDADGLDPEITKLANMIFGNGVKLAKLVDPALAAAGAARINLNLNQQINAGQAQAMTPNALMASIVRELEQQGVPRDEITPMMISEYIVSQQRPAIEAAVVAES